MWASGQVAWIDHGEMSADKWYGGCGAFVVIEEKAFGRSLAK